MGTGGTSALSTDVSRESAVARAVEKLGGARRPARFYRLNPPVGGVSLMETREATLQVQLALPLTRSFLTLGLAPTRPRTGWSRLAPCLAPTGRCIDRPCPARCIVPTSPCADPSLLRLVRPLVAAGC